MKLIINYIITFILDIRFWDLDLGKIQSLKHKLPKSILFLSSMLLSTSIWAQQTYPVRTTISVKYPSVFLDEYADMTNTSATVTLLDLQKNNYNVLVRLTMESPDLKLSSREPIPLTLNGGVPTELDFNDPNIAKLFSYTNLIPEKGKVDEFLQSRTLPEGLYMLKLEVYDANLPTINVSNVNANITMVLVQLFDPPLLNLPDGASPILQDPFSMNLFFSWTPRSIIANPAIQIYYQINMVEVPEGRNPYDAINIAEALYPITMLSESGITFPTFSFTPEQLPMTQGRTYAWQVTAYEQDAITGARRYQRFRNSGKSMVHTFTIQENCQQVDPSSIFTEITGDQVRVTWDKAYGHTEYELNYRELGSIYQYTPVRVLVRDDNTSQQSVFIDISSLEKGIQYEFKIAAKCKSWQQDVYGGIFKVEKQDCSAPQPIRIESRPSGVVLTWDATENTQKYRLRYKGGNNALENEQTIEVANTTVTLPTLQAGKAYQIILDAVCVSGNLDLGRPYTIHEGENGYAGGCPIPQPFKLIVDHTPNSTLTTFKWSSSVGIHQAYKFYIVRKDLYDIAPTTVAWAQANTSVPQLSVDTLVEDRLYAYKVDYICDNGQTNTTPVGYFKLEKEPTVAVNPGTGNCFPPATYTAEGRSSSSANFEWSKSQDAEEYQLFYAPKGSNDFKVFNTTQKHTTLEDLTTSTSQIYKYKIRARCPNAKYSIFTDTALVDLSQIYTGNCKYEGVFRSDRQAATEIRLVWQHTPNMGYVITYRDEAQPVSQVYTAQINSDSISKNNLLDADSIRFTITDLASKTNYVFHLQPICGTEQGKKVGPLTVATLEGATNGACGQGKVVCDSKSTVPLNKDSLVAMTKTSGGGVEYYEYDKAGKQSMFSAADVEIITLDPLAYDATTMTFSGTGVAKLELNLGNVGTALTGSSDVNLTDRLKTSVKFTNIKINDARCLIGGAVEIIGLELNVLSDEQKARANQYVQQYNDVMKQLIDAGKQLSEALDLATQYTEQAENYLDGGQKYGNVKTGSIVPVPANADYSVTGNTVKDKSGNTIATITTPAPVLTGKDTTLCQKCGKYIEFTNAPGAAYDFDEYKEEYFTHRKVAREYKALRYTGGKYYHVSAKAMVEGKVDKVKIKSLNTYNASDLSFKSGAGVTYVFNQTDLTITLPGGAAGDGQDIYVYSRSKGDSVVGRLLVANYPSVSNKVVFVVVGDPATWTTKPNFTVANVKTEVEKLVLDSYKRVGVHYNIEIDDLTLKTDNSWDANNDGMVQDSRSGFLDNNFTGEEKALAELYYSYFENLDTTKAYLFFTPDGKLTDADLQGKMPRGSKAGFIFMNNSNLATVAKTVVHELGHGPHSLHHLFNSDWLGSDADISNAQNLMAYGSGIDLIKPQWDILHDPGVVLGFFERDRDAMLSSGYWVDPAGNVIYLEGNFSGWVFPDKLISGEHVNGIVYGMVINKELWTAKIVDDKFYGYFKTVNGNFSGTPRLYPSIKEGDIVTAKLLKYNFNCTSDYIEKDYKVSQNSPTLTELNNGLSLVRDIDLTDDDKPYKTNVPIGGCTAGDNIKIGWIIYVANANKRKKEAPYDILTPIQYFIKGTEVEIVKNYDKKKSEVRYKGQSESWAVAISNLKPILAVQKNGDYVLTIDFSPLTLPYASTTKPLMKKNDKFNILKECGDYYLAHRAIDGDLGWVPKKNVRKMPKDISNNFEALFEAVSLTGSSVPTAQLNKVLSNRAKVNDRSDREIYNPKLQWVTYNGRLGLQYKGTDLVTSAPNYPTQIQQTIANELMAEIYHEGSWSSINAYDNERFTWGKGFSANGALVAFIEKLFSKNSNYSRIFLEVGIKIEGGNLMVLNDQGQWLTDIRGAKDGSTLKASIYIASKIQLCSFFAEFGEKSDYRQDVADAQVEVFCANAGNFPDYLYNVSSNDYADSWDASSVRFLCHMGHWLPSLGWGAGYTNYKPTKGEWKNILYKVIHRSTSAYHSGTYNTNMYLWTGAYQIYTNPLTLFSSPKGIAKTKLNDIWSSNLINVEFKKDKDNIARVKVVGEDKYVSNNNCTIVELDDRNTIGGQCIIVTENAAAIQYETFDDGTK